MPLGLAYRVGRVYPIRNEFSSKVCPSTNTYQPAPNGSNAFRKRLPTFRFHRAVAGLVDGRLWYHRNLAAVGEGFQVGNFKQKYF